MKRIIKITELPKIRRKYKDKKIVLGTGCFDIIHWGHVHFLENSAKQGDILVVGINSDSSIKLIKGKDRPIMNEDQRARLLVALRVVDYLFVYDDTTAKDYILSLKPDVFAMGEGSVDAYPDEREATEQVGAKLHIIKRKPAPSTTSIISTIQKK